MPTSTFQVIHQHISHDWLHLSPDQDNDHEHRSAIESCLKAVENRLEDESAFTQFIAEKTPSSSFLVSLFKICSLSPFVLSSLSGDLLLIQSLYCESGEVSTRPSGYLKEALTDLIGECQDEATLFKTLRIFRRREMVRIVWRDLLKFADLADTMAKVSELADACITIALNWLYRQACEKWGVPAGASIDNNPMIVLGMGKLGAFELNLSSDIDLIFTYPESGETSGGRRSIDNQTFFIRLGQRLIAALDEVTAEGFVFRVDMRLRPYGQSGALALSFTAMEEYYQTQGRDWERYAMIKARAITGMGKDRQALKAMLTPFVYRKYTDFSVFDSLRDMKAMIEAEVTRKGMLQNVKLGPGGIREVEFIAQAHQLIYGGKIPSLQNPCLKVSFMEMVNLELFPEDVAQSLLDAYEYLRNVEHGIQGMVDKQSQQLPVEDLERWRLSIIMGASNWDEFIQQLDNVRAVVKSHFEAFIQPVQASELKNPRHDNADAIEQVSFWKKFWNQLCLHYEEAEFYEELTTEQQDLFPILDKLLRQSILKKVSAEGRKRFDRFMPQLLLLVHEMPDPIYSLQSVVSVVMAVIRRTAYLVLLYENPIAFRHFIHLCSESEWIADTLSKTPSLLDEFLNTRTLYAPPNPKALSSELQLQLLAVPEEEEERQLEVLKFFKNSHVLRVAASEIQGTLPTMKVSDYLSWIAETVLKYAMDLAWAQISQKYGVPVYANGELDEQPYSRFAVVAYGKLGGLELSYSSDLDMVFIVDDDIQGATNGQRSIENSVFYSRLGQRILHILSSKTASGILYETDMRLRPSGNSGLLVTTLSAYRKYQEVSAWTWEKQAMVRARWVAGSTKLFQAFNGIRKDMLCTSRKDDALREEIIAMRIKMYEAFKSKKQKDASIFDLKQEYGGLVDIEFLVQYAVLKNAFLEPSLAEWSDNMRILDTISDSGIWDEAQCRQLQSAYLLLRAKGHACVLQNKPLQISVSEVAEKVRQVDVIWKRQMADFSRG